jgi:FlaA1/EpsC-like NDP-sugar epimerase
MYDMIHSLINLSRKRKQTLMLLFDGCAVVSSIFMAFSLRLGYFYFPTKDYDLLIVMIASPLLALPIFIVFGLYREVVRYVGFTALWRINQAVTLYAVLWALIVFMTVVEGIPRSVILINWILVVMSVGGSRFFARWLLSEINASSITFQKRNALIYGAGAAGRELCTALYQSKEYKPVAFIDNADELYRQSIKGLEVFNEDDLANLIEKHNVKEVLLAMPSVSKSIRSKIINRLKSYPVVVRSLPSLVDLAQGKVSVNDLFEIDLRDLLGREPVKPNLRLLETNITNKAVLVTGAGGSIGSELCRQIISLSPKKLVLFEISESALYEIHQQLLIINAPNVEIFPVIGSTADKDRMEHIYTYYDVNTIYHAAAYKHVPLVECNPEQGLLNNAIGTLVAAKAAISSNVETFVLISTDKAVRPTNVMGASKRIAELVLQALDKGHNNTCFTMVRFGNVLDSSGSVIPLFKKQIKSGGPVTVTHANVVRYFMTIPEAVELVIQAGAMSKGGEVFVLDMGEPIRIYDLAVKMIQLSGLKVRDKNNLSGDIEIQYTGLRPGEKLYEELLVDGSFAMTENKLIRRAEEQMIDWVKLEPMLFEIKKYAQNIQNTDQNKKLYQLIKRLVPEFNPQANSSNNL